MGPKHEKRQETLVVVVDEPIRVRHCLAALTTHPTAVIAIACAIAAKIKSHVSWRPSIGLRVR